MTNVGSQSLTVNQVVIDGVNPGDFTGLINHCRGTLDPTDSCTIQTSFSPTTTGTRTADLAITHTAPGSPKHITLQGTGT